MEHRPGAAGHEPVTLACVYRRRNAGHVRRLADQATAAGWVVRLHALDDRAPELEPWTVSSGPGGRFALLDALSAAEPGSLVIADDDVRLPRLVRFVAECRRARFDVAQPAHGWRSRSSHVFGYQQPAVRSRTVSFVEIGPVVAFSPAARAVLQPFPHDGMGWGVEVDWHLRARAGELRLGMVDLTPMWHLDAPATAYDRQDEDAALDVIVRAAGYDAIEDMHWTVARHGLGFSAALLRRPLAGAGRTDLLAPTAAGRWGLARLRHDGWCPPGSATAARHAAAARTDLRA